VQLYYNNLFLFQGHYVARDVEGVREGKRLFTVHVDLLERLQTFDESLIAPPAGVELKPWQPEPSSYEDARFEPLDSLHVFTLNPANSSLKPPVLIKRVAADYSPAAKAMRASGEVVVQFTVAKDGTVKNAKALSGHELLRSDCVEAVKRWRYAPGQINGEPVETQVSTTFYFAKPNP
jgi:TonB family protein